MMRGDLLFLDTNVLLSATVRTRTDHAACRDLFHKAAGLGVHFVTIPQVFREYLVVATRPAASNGLGLTSREALYNVEAFRTRMHLLPETTEVFAELLSLARDNPMAGKRIHDANLVAAMQAHNVRTMISANVSDFDAFQGINVQEPAAALAQLERANSGS